MEPDSTKDGVDLDESSKSECAVCLQQYVQPVQLPCRHIFCYLCVKGVTNQNKRCAMCRQEIPATYLDNPNLIAAPSESVAFEGSYQWFYAGRNGWWQYDDRTSSEIEAAHQKGDKECEVLIAGFLYVIDLERSVQFRRNDPSRKRHIKRDLVTITKKGVAGIRSAHNPDLPADNQSGMDPNSSDDFPSDNVGDSDYPSDNVGDCSDSDSCPDEAESDL